MIVRRGSSTSSSTEYAHGESEPGAPAGPAHPERVPAEPHAHPAVAGPDRLHPGRRVLAERLDLVQPVQPGHPADGDLGDLGPHAHRGAPAQQVRQHPAGGGGRGDLRGGGHRRRARRGSRPAAPARCRRTGRRRGGWSPTPGRAPPRPARARDRPAQRRAAHVLGPVRADAEDRAGHRLAQAAGAGRPPRPGRRRPARAGRSISSRSSQRRPGWALPTSTVRRLPGAGAEAGPAGQQGPQPVPPAQLAELAQPLRRQRGAQHPVGHVVRPRLGVLDQQPGPHRGGGAFRDLAELAGHGRAPGCRGGRRRSGGDGGGGHKGQVSLS